MTKKVILAFALFCGLTLAYPQSGQLASPFSNSVFPPQTFTATGQTGAVIQLNGLVVPSTVGSSFSSCIITVTGLSNGNTVTFSVLGSSANGTTGTYFALPIYTVASPLTAPSTAVTATTNGQYSAPCGAMTHVEFQTSGTFTATSVTLTLTGSPNATMSKSGSGGGATVPTDALVFGLSPLTSRAATPTDVSTLLQNATGCPTAGTVYSPQSNTCITPASGATPAGSTYQMQLKGTSGLAAGILYDATTHLDATNAGAINGIRSDYVEPGTQTSNFPIRNPYVLSHYANMRSSYADQYFPFTVNLYMNSGSSGALLTNGTGNDTNIAGIQSNLETHSPIQIGGWFATTINQYGLDDSVVNTVYNHCQGIERGDNEGCEFWRTFEDFAETPFGGTMVPLGNDPLGNAKLQVTATSGYSVGSSAENRELVDISSKWTSPGNIASVVPYSDSRFVEINGDSSSGIDTKFGASIFTPLLSAADNQKYNGSCPSTAIGTYTTDPYATDGNGNSSIDGSVTQTAHYCLNFATAGMNVGDVIGIWAGGPNYEYTTIQSIADSTHAVVTLKRPHAAGEIITGHGALGYAIRATVDEGDNVFYPIMGSIAGNHLVIYVNSDVTNKSGEYKGLYYSSNTATTAAAITPTMSGGAVVSITSTAGNYQISNNNTLPVPTVTFGGTGSCAVPPTFSFASVGNGWQPTLLTPGSSCPSNLTVTVQSVYPNPFSIYTATRTAFVDNPAMASVAPTSSDPNPMATSGYIVTDPWAAGTPASGQTVDLGHWWQRYLGDQQNYTLDILAAHSGRSGPINNVSWTNVGQTTLLNYRNMTPANYTLGRAINNWLPGNPSLPPCPDLGSETVPCYDPHDGAFGSPTVIEAQGLYNQGIRFDFPPTPGGTIFYIGCSDGGGGIRTYARCNAATPLWASYDLFQLVSATGLYRLTFDASSDANGGLLTWGGPFAAGSLKSSGGIAMNGSITGLTSLSMNGAFSGATTVGFGGTSHQLNSDQYGTAILQNPTTKVLQDFWVQRLLTNDKIEFACNTWSAPSGAVQNYCGNIQNNGSGQIGFGADQNTYGNATIAMAGYTFTESTTGAATSHAPAPSLTATFTLYDPGTLPTVSGMALVSDTGGHENWAAIFSPILSITGSIGGSALAVNACSTGTAAITGGTAGHAVQVSGGTLLGGNYKLDAVVTNSTTVTVEVCAIVAGTPTAQTYNVSTY